MSDESSVIREAMAALARRRWAKATPADRVETARRMMAGRRKARKHRLAKQRGK